MSSQVVVRSDFFNVFPTAEIRGTQVSHICNSYTMPTRAVWDLLPEPEGEGNKFHTARGSMV